MARKSPRWNVCLIEDAAEVRNSLRILFEEAGLPLTTFPTAQEFFDGATLDDCGCLILAQNLPGISGLDFFERLKPEHGMPVIFLCGRGEVPFAVAAMRAGAFDVQQKPLRGDALLESVRRACAHHERLRVARLEKDAILERIGRLSRRELQVLDQMVAGKKNRDIARDLEISEKTLDIHRLKVLEKLEARTVADAVRCRLLSRADAAAWPDALRSST
jgi:FixJ family two-component response regulator